MLPVISFLRSPRRAALMGAALGVAAACASPTAMCGCPPARWHGVAFGTVRTAAGAPVAGAQVHAVIPSGGCSAQSQDADPIPPQRPTTTANGGYELHFYSVSGGETQCVRVVASRAPGDSAFTQVAAFPLRLDSEDPPRQAADVVFP
jgi:hypothetical protein